MRILRMLKLPFGWLAAVSFLLVMMIEVDLQWNFFDWSPKWDMAAAMEVGAISAVLALIWFLAERTRDRISQTVSALICLSLVGIAACVLPAEEVTKTPGKMFLERPKASPLWYRGSCCALLCLPGVFWLWRVRRGSSKNEPGKKDASDGRENHPEGEQRKPIAG